MSTTAEVTRPKKAAKESNKPKRSQIKEESLRKYIQRELLNSTENSTMLMSMVTGVLGIPALGSRRAPDFDLRNSEELKEFLKEFKKLAKKSRLMTREKAKIMVKYADKKMK